MGDEGNMSRYTLPPRDHHAHHQNSLDSLERDGDERIPPDSRILAFVSCSRARASEMPLLPSRLPIP